jgi:hypothetical protein
MYRDNQQKLRQYRDIFPTSSAKYLLNPNNIGIKTGHNNAVLVRILESINSYLVNNQGAVCDFHLMKDIVDRNCDSLEEEISTQIPMPLYYGLMGTMAGILVGVGFFVGGGGLDSLMAGNASAEETASFNAGVESLLGGVAMAMIAGISGLFLTTIGSASLKDTKVYVERNKHTFLSWIQAKLLPSLSSDVSGALVRMSENLGEFNETFMSNAHQLEQMAGTQQRLFEAIEKMRITDIASANIAVYEHLQGTTGQIELLGKHLKDVNEYNAAMREYYEATTAEIKNRQAFIDETVGHIDEALVLAFRNIRADLEEQMTTHQQLMHHYYETLAEEIKARNGYVSEAVGKVDDALQKSFFALKESSERQIEKIRELGVIQSDKLDRVIDEQEKFFENHVRRLQEGALQQMEILQNALREQQQKFNEKLNELPDAIDELRHLHTLRTDVDTLEEKYADGFRLLEERIRELAQYNKELSSRPLIRLPRMSQQAKAVVSTVIFILGFACVAYVIHRLG